MSDTDETMCAIEVRIHPCAGLQLEKLSVFRDDPDAGKRGAQVLHDGFGTGLKNACQRVVRRQRRAYVRPDRDLSASSSAQLIPVFVP